MSREITINIDGYGVVKVNRPLKLTKQSVTTVVADAVVQTCQLLRPNHNEKKFHPVLGVGGYIEDKTVIHSYSGEEIVKTIA